jgi:predicted nucleotidyltransferase
LKPKFVIAAGTQVVLKTMKHLPDDAGFKKAGSVGVVVGCPELADGPYVVEFADGHAVSACFQELTLRRQEIDELLGATDVDLRPYVFYRCQVGSKAFGLATDVSDDDLRGIYLPPARLHWSLYRLPEQLESNDEEGDQVYWELEKFLRLALKANPNVLETLWTPLVLHADEVALELRGLRHVFLSQHVYKTYSGYVLSQFRRMANAFERTGAFKAKHAMHLIRLLYSGIEVLRTGEIQVDVGPHRDELLAIRGGRLAFEQVRQRALGLDREFQQAFERTSLPEQPDFAAVNDFLCRARRKMVDA